MTLEDILDRVRALYVETLSATLAERARSVEVVAEALVCDPAGRPAPGGELRVPSRVDACLLRDGKADDTVLVESNRRLGFNPIRFSWTGNLPVTLHPFVWDECRLRVQGESTDLQPVQRWFQSWVDPDDRGAPGADGLRGVVHSISDPELSRGAWTVCVDLGSAPVRAFEALLDALALAGATGVSVGDPGGEP